MYADLTEPEMFEEWRRDLNEAEIAEFIEEAHAEGKSLFQLWQAMEFGDLTEAKWLPWEEVFPPRQIDPPRDTGLEGGDEHTAYDEIGSTRAYDADEAARAADWSASFWKGAKS